MDLKLLKSDIQSNNIPNFLVFNVDEPALAKQYIKQMSSTLNKYTKYYDTLDEVIYETTTNLKDDYLYIVLNPIIKDAHIIETIINLNRNIILYFTELDSKSLLYKSYKDFIVDFKKIDKYTILAYLMKYLNMHKITVEQNKLDRLIDYCNCNFSLCINEIDKIVTLGQDNSNILVEYMLSNGFSDYRKVNIFVFIQKILNKDKSVFEDVFKIDDSAISIFTILYNQAKNRLIKYNNNFYAHIMNLCYRLDCGIKDGTINAESALDYLLVEVFNE